MDLLSIRLQLNMAIEHYFANSSTIAWNGKQKTKNIWNNKVKQTKWFEAQVNDLILGRSELQMVKSGIFLN